MAFRLELSGTEARLLALHLDRHLQRLDAELVRTDKHELQHSLAQEIAALQKVAARLEGMAVSKSDDAPR